MAKSRHFSIFVIGETGNGKSQFCQYLTEDPKNPAPSPFHPSQSADSFTQQVFSKTVEKYDHSFTVYDTPGLNDKESKADSKHIQTMVTSLREVKNCKAFLIVLNPHQPRFTASTQQTVEYFRDLFGSDIIANLGLIWTRASKGLADRWRKSKEKEYVSKIRALFGETITAHTPSFYVNSAPLDDTYEYDEQFHESEIHKLLTWAGSNEVYDCGHAKIVKAKIDEAEEEKKKLEEEKKKLEEENKKRDEEKKKLEEENKRLEEENKKRDEEKKRLEEENKKRDQEIEKEKKRLERELEEERNRNRAQRPDPISPLLPFLISGLSGLGFGRSGIDDEGDSIRVQQRVDGESDSIRTQKRGGSRGFGSDESPSTPAFVSREPRRQVCMGQTKAGSPCKAWALRDSMYCKWHG